VTGGIHFITSDGGARRAMVDDTVNHRSGEAFIVDLVEKIFCYNVGRVFFDVTVRKAYVVRQAFPGGVIIILILGAAAWSNSPSNNSDGLEFSILRQHPGSVLIRRSYAGWESIARPVA
jgi:hypothetical protein